jgi:hypothetical protein
VRAKGPPIAAYSKRNIGTLVVDQAPMKTITLKVLDPFRSRTVATGKAA